MTMQRLHARGCPCCAGEARSLDAAAQERRLFLGLLALASVAPLAACGDSSKPAASTTPVEITQGTSCELDGMLLMDYPGPKGQIHFADAEQPLFYCDTMEVLNTLIVPEQIRKVNAVYVQDMGQADWNAPKGHWIDAKTAVYVVGGKRHGSMGPTIGSFAQEADAKKFAGEYGGKVLRFAEITPAMVDLSGGALHDTRM